MLTVTITRFANGHFRSSTTFRCDHAMCLGDGVAFLQGTEPVVTVDYVELITMRVGVVVSADPYSIPVSLN